MKGERRVVSAGGMTLVEILIATVVISVAAAGILSYEYHAVRQARGAFARACAIRIAEVVLADWKANGGSYLYSAGLSSPDVPNPVTMGMGFTRVKTNVYKTDVDGIALQVTLSRPDVFAGSPILITATVQWKLDFTDNTPDESDPLVSLCTYARVDQMGG